MKNLTLPPHIFDDLNRFVSNHYQEQIPSSHIVSREFLSKFQYYNKDVCLSDVINALEYISINRDF